MEQEVLRNASIGFIISGLLVGGVFGFIIQRGRYCANTAFRDIIFVNDVTMFRAFLLALITMIIGANLLNDMGLFTLKPQTFYPFANVIGGFLFGIGMVLAGGCGSGVWYRTGEGHLGAWVAVLGFLIGASATTNGILNPLYKFLRGVKISIAGRADARLWEILGDGMMEKWIVIAVLALAAFLFLYKGKPFSIGKQKKGFYWSVTGALIGITGVVAFWASQYWGGGEFARGLNFTSPTAELLNVITTGQTQPMFAQEYTLGPFKVTWIIFTIIGVPIGAYLSARGLKEFIWKVPPPKELVTAFLAGLLMGFSGILGGGCTVGQALTGLTTLSIGSLVASIFMVLGNWTIVYYKFIKPMKEM